MNIGTTRNAVCVTILLACAPGMALAGGRARNGSPAQQFPETPTPGSAAQAQAADAAASRPIAMVDGQPVYERDLAGQSAAQLRQARQQVYKIESDALEAVIRRKVVEEEARKEGLSVTQLYAKEVDSKVPEASDEEARGYFLAVKSQTTLSFSAVEPQIKRFIKNAEIEQARNQYADSLRANADVSILLQPPAVDLGQMDPARVEGDPHAPITIVEFGDYQCPFCGRVELTLKAVLNKYKGQVKLAFRDFPLSSIHRYADVTAEASRCAEVQGKFWPMHDAMYADQSRLDEADLLMTANNLGLDEDAFAACLKSSRYAGAIAQDTADGARAGVTGTPAFFINGRFLSGAIPESQFEAVIDSELAALKNGKSAAPPH